MSALCSLEHFGLGRYGDAIDPEACFKCFDQIQKKLKKGGNLYISLPVGQAHLSVVRPQSVLKRLNYPTRGCSNSLASCLPHDGCCSHKHLFLHLTWVTKGMGLLLSLHTVSDGIITGSF